ncbi:flagella synthesis protein FlgN [Bordetella petrii]|uniref:flagella synthesis protein FlgN n=1 Tax=Bordetella petrii TaxID=94624 RepID=UPI00372F4886
MTPSADLLACLADEDALVREFAETLEAEAAALADRTAFERLPALTQHKETLARQLVALSDRRDALLERLGLPAGHSGAEQAASRYPELAAPWQALLAHAEIARERNARNRALVEISLRHTQQSLDALRELGGLAGAGTYDAQGRGARTGYGGRSIVAA